MLHCSTEQAHVIGLANGEATVPASLRYHRPPSHREQSISERTAGAIEQFDDAIEITVAPHALMVTRVRCGKAVNMYHIVVRGAKGKPAQESAGMDSVAVAWCRSPGRNPRLRSARIALAQSLLAGGERSNGAHRHRVGTIGRTCVAQHRDVVCAGGSLIIVQRGVAITALGRVVRRVLKHRGGRVQRARPGEITMKSVKGIRTTEVDGHIGAGVREREGVPYRWRKPQVGLQGEITIGAVAPAVVPVKFSVPPRPFWDVTLEHASLEALLHRPWRTG